MHARTILAVAAAAFLLAAMWRIRRDKGRIAPPSATWLLVGCMFAAISAWLWLR
ncbi:hypothetical protein [Pseudoduganella namucuonensis]|uniref:hypothetical protein n=1 Tax=Pseudoduganella namucuonensis TaxID=1035707 RepID=UPI0015A58262|nr:hypothetical protein [Pseudoduganella namucuonensis]